MLCTRSMEIWNPWVRDIQPRSLIMLGSLLLSNQPILARSTNLDVSKPTKFLDLYSFAVPQSFIHNRNGSGFDSRYKIILFSHSILYRIPRMTVSHPHCFEILDLV
jgi:hypothetical protein